jgi:dTMP kinase
VTEASPYPAVYAESGVFVCFEGGEGSGKSTQARLLSERLTAEGYAVRLTHEPGDTPVGQELRRIVLSPETGSLSPRTEALLYIADKAEHVDTVVQPALDRAEVVITDRYVDSTLAYQGAGRDLTVAGLEQVARWATHGLRPNLTIVLDLAQEHGLSRFEGRDRIEMESLEFLERAREAFLGLAEADPEHYLVIDARLGVEEIANRVLAAVRPLLDQAKRAPR